MKIKNNYRKTIVGALLAALVSVLAIPVFAQSGGSPVIRAQCVANVATVEWSGFFGGRYSEAVSIYINDKVVASGMGTFGTLQKDVRTLDKIQADAPKQITVKAYGSKTGFVEAAPVSCTTQPTLPADTQPAATTNQFAPSADVNTAPIALQDEHGNTPVVDNASHSVGTQFSRTDPPWNPGFFDIIRARAISTATGVPVPVILDQFRHDYVTNVDRGELEVAFYESLRIFCYPPGYVEVWYTDNKREDGASAMVAQFHIAFIAQQGDVTLPAQDGGFLTIRHVGDDITIVGAGSSKTIPFSACLESARVTKETIPQMTCNADAVVQQQALIADQQAYVAKLEPVKTAVATRDEYANASAHLVKLQNGLTALQAGCSQ